MPIVREVHQRQWKQFYYINPLLRSQLTNEKNYKTDGRLANAAIKQGETHEGELFGNLWWVCN
jgi:hypothetical protein